jgi:hypothetical protein
VKNCIKRWFGGVILSQTSCQDSFRTSDTNMFMNSDQLTAFLTHRTTSSSPFFTPMFLAEYVQTTFEGVSVAFSRSNCQLVSPSCFEMSLPLTLHQWKYEVDSLSNEGSYCWMQIRAVMVLTGCPFISKPKVTKSSP